jgi:hypothetical protein
MSNLSPRNIHSSRWVSGDSEYYDDATACYIINGNGSDMGRDDCYCGGPSTCAVITTVDQGTTCGYVAGVVTSNPIGLLSNNRVNLTNRMLSPFHCRFFSLFCFIASSNFRHDRRTSLMLSFCQTITPLSCSTALSL